MDNTKAVTGVKGILKGSASIGAGETKTTRSKSEAPRFTIDEHPTQRMSSTIDFVNNSTTSVALTTEENL